MINELIEQFVGELKKEQVYIAYINALDRLNQHAHLLEEYRHTKEEYIKMKPYFKYQDFSLLQSKFFDLSSQVTNLEEFKEYQIANQLLKDRLDELSLSIFNQVLIDTKENICALSQEYTNEEI